MVKLLAGYLSLKLFVFVPFLLQLSGTVGAYWINEDGINKGFFREVHPDMSVHDNFMGTDTVSIVLHLSACVLLLVMMVNSFIRLVYLRCLSGVQPSMYSRCFRINRLLFRGSVYAYFPSSLLILVGCILFGNNHPLEIIGTSFYMCLSACLMMWLVTSVCICDQLCKERRANHVFDTMLVQMYRM